MLKNETIRNKQRYVRKVVFLVGNQNYENFEKLYESISHIATK